MANNKNGKKNESGNFSDFKMETTQLDGVVDASKLTMQDWKFSILRQRQLEQHENKY